MAALTPDYYMDIFFRDHKIDFSDVEIVDMNVFKMTDAIANGELDAIFTWQPHVENAKKKLGDNAVLFQSRARYSTSWLIIVMKEFAEKNPDVLVKFLNAIVKAEKFINKYPNEAQIIHSQLSKTDLDTTRLLWGVVKFDLSISESLIQTLEGEAKWVIRRQLSLFNTCLC